MRQKAIFLMLAVLLTFTVVSGCASKEASTKAEGEQ